MIVQIIEEHPVPFAIGGAVLLLLIISRMSSPSVALANNSQQLATAQNTQIASINAGLATSLSAQSVEASNAAEAAATARASIVADVLKTSVTANAALAANNTNAQVQMFAQATNSANNKLQIEDNAANQTLAINAAVKTNSDNLATQLQINANDNNAKLNGLTQTIQAQLSPAMMQHQENMASLAGTYATQMASIQTHAANTTADATARATNAKTSQGWLSTIGSVASAIFSFL